MRYLAMIMLALMLSGCEPCLAEPSEVAGYDVERLANAIYYAEGGANTRHPYGILSKYKHTTPRQACINTIRSKHREWVALGAKGDYLAYLQSRYAPINSDTDNGTNQFWLKNVLYFYQTA